MKPLPTLLLASTIIASNTTNNINTNFGKLDLTRLGFVYIKSTPEYDIKAYTEGNLLFAIKNILPDTNKLTGRSTQLDLLHPTNIQIVIYKEPVIVKNTNDTWTLTFKIK